MGVDETVLPALSLALSLMNLLEEPTRRDCNWWAPVAASEVATWLPYTEERGEATLGCRRDLSCCRGPSAGSCECPCCRRSSAGSLGVGRRRRAKEEGLELEQDPCSGATVENLEISFA